MWLPVIAHNRNFPARTQCGSRLCKITEIFLSPFEKCSYIEKAQRFLGDN